MFLIVHDRIGFRALVRVGAISALREYEGGDVDVWFVDGGHMQVTETIDWFTEILAGLAVPGS